MVRALAPPRRKVPQEFTLVRISPLPQRVRAVLPRVPPTVLATAAFLGSGASIPFALIGPGGKPRAAAAPVPSSPAPTALGSTPRYRIVGCRSSGDRAYLAGPAGARSRSASTTGPRRTHPRS